MIATVTTLTAWMLMATGAPTAPSATAMNFLRKNLSQEATAPVVLLSLQASRDKELLPIFLAAVKSKDPRVGRIAPSGIMKVAGDDGAKILHQLPRGQDETRRAEILVYLTEKKAISDAELLQELSAKGERVRCLAARALVTRKKDTPAVRAALAKLAGSDDPATEAMARLSMLALGDTDQLAPVEKIVARTDLEQARAIVVEQIFEQKIAAAAGILRTIGGDTSTHPRMRLRAYECLADMTPDPALTCLAAMQRTTNPVLRAYLLRKLADRKNAAKYLPKLVNSDAIVAPLAAMEIARAKGPAGAKELQAAAIKCLDSGIPVQIDHVLRRARDDAEDDPKKAAAFVGPLLRYIGRTRPSHPGDPYPPRVSIAASVLCEIGLPAAINGLKALVGRNDKELSRAIASGMVTSANPAAASLAQVLVKDAYPEIQVKAALVLTRHKKPGGEAILQHFLASSRDRDVPLSTIAAWYLIRSAGQAKAAADQLARVVPRDAPRTAD